MRPDPCSPPIYNKTDMPQSTPTYAEAIQNLSALIPELFVAPAPAGSPSQPRRKFSLDQIQILCQALDNPQQKFPSVLIAGTNGKGSTASTLAAIAHASGLKTGLYTSPHLSRVNERIKLNGQDIPDQDFARLYFQVHDTAQQLVLDQKLPTLPSYFELLTALAFAYFAEQKIDLAILEVGMGGRLDATNIVSPILSVITDISLDHQEWLGSTIAEITREKAGILRPNGTLVTLPQHPEANQALGEIAVPLNVRAISATEYMPARSSKTETSPQTYEIDVLGQQIQINSPLKGAHQHRNIALAVAAAIELSRNETFSRFPITPESIAKGIQSTHWPGRLETLQIGPQQFILDVAHNPAGAWALRSALNQFHEQRAEGVSPHAQRKESAEAHPPHGQCLIFACLRDKPLREMTQILFPIFDHVVLAPIQSPRANEVAGLLAAAQATGVPSTPTQSVAEAIATAQSLPVATVVISGSVYLVGEARTILLDQKKQDPQP